MKKFIFSNNKNGEKMKIALIQQSASEDINSNLNKGIANAKTAIQNGAQIICFSELAFTRFYPQKIADENSKT